VGVFAATEDAEVAGLPPVMAEEETEGKKEGEKMKSKVFVGSVTHYMHSHHMERWIKTLENQTHPPSYVYVVEQSKEDDNYNKWKDSFSNLPGDGMVRGEWSDFVFKRMTENRNKVREKFLETDCTHILMLDTDIFLNPNTIERLLAHDKDIVDPLIPCGLEKNKGRWPAVLKDTVIHFLPNGQYALDLYTWEEVEGKGLQRVYAAGLGCSLAKRKVYEKVGFRWVKGLRAAEDMLWYEEVKSNDFEFWVDGDMRVTHEGNPWNPIWEQEEKDLENNLFVMNTDEVKISGRDESGAECKGILG